MIIAAAPVLTDLLNIFAGVGAAIVIWIIYLAIRANRG